MIPFLLGARETNGVQQRLCRRGTRKGLSKLEFDNTYYLAYRDLPELIKRYAPGKRALDFGCGAGRSTRFLKSLGLTVTGIDVAADMLREARRTDPDGDYRLLPEGDLSSLSAGFDLILAAFTFDNVPTERKLPLFVQLRRLLATEGVLLNLVSSPEIYTHEWASFTTKDFPENKKARDGDVVRIVTTEIADPRPCADILCGDEAYRGLYRKAGLKPLETRRPMATGHEPYTWVSETTVAPWVVWILSPALEGRPKSANKC